MLKIHENDYDQLSTGTPIVIDDIYYVMKQPLPLGEGHMQCSLIPVGSSDRYQGTQQVEILDPEAYAKLAACDARLELIAPLSPDDYAPFLRAIIIKAQKWTTPQYDIIQWAAKRVLTKLARLKSFDSPGLES